jgi:hypothetical protein
MTDVHQCPACELKFRNKTELEYHWAEEHRPPAQVEVEPVQPQVIDEDPAP